MIAELWAATYCPPMVNKSTNQHNVDGRPERIAKLLARAGVGSRRDVERMITEKRIRLEGKLVETPVTLIASTSGITVDGRPVAEPERSRLWRYHKPKGLVTTNRDPEGRKTVFDALPGELPRVVTIGRLDINTEGLLLLTNDGAIARWIELPKTGWQRRYRVRVNGLVNESALRRLADGITVQGIKYEPIEAKLTKAQGANAWLELRLREGKNREVKKVLEHLGLRVNRLIRTAFGPFELGGLERGEIGEVPAQAIRENLPPNLGGGSTRELQAKARTKPAMRKGTKPAARRTQFPKKSKKGRP